MIVADATVLIVLAKMERLELLKVVYGEVLVGPAVKREALDQGRAIAARGVEQIGKAFAAGWLRTVRPTTTERRLSQQFLEKSGVAEGEAESLALARVRKLTLIVDDKEARSLAAAHAVVHLGTAGVLLQAFRSGCMSFEDLENSVRDLSSVMWLSPLVVAEILRRVRVKES